MAANQVHGTSSKRGHLRGVPSAYAASTFPRLAPADEIAAVDGQNGQIIKNTSSFRASGAVIGQGPSGAFAGRGMQQMQQVQNPSNKSNLVQFKE